MAALPEWRGKVELRRDPGWAVDGGWVGRGVGVGGGREARAYGCIWGPVYVCWHWVVTNYGVRKITSPDET